MWKVAWGVVVGLLLWFVVLPVAGVVLVALFLAYPEAKDIAVRSLVMGLGGGFGVAIGQYYRRLHQLAS